MRIKKQSLLKFIIDLPIIFFVILRETQDLTGGDAKQYQIFFELLLSGEGWPMAAGGEPTWMLVVNFASIFADYGLIFIMSLIILFLIYQLSEFLNYRDIVSRIFIILLILPNFSIGLHLCNAWRTTLSIFLLFSFLKTYYSQEDKLKQYKLILLTPLLLFSHSVGILIGTIFISLKEIVVPFFKNIIKLKLKLLSLIYLIAGSSIFLISVPIVLRTTYFKDRFNEYFNESYDQFELSMGIIKDSKPLSLLLIKALLLLLIELLIFIYKKRNNNNLFKREFNLYLCLTYAVLILTAFIQTNVADRLINSIYWITTLSIINFNINFLKNNLLPTRLN